MVGFVGDCVGDGVGVEDSGIDSIVGLVGIDSGATEDSVGVFFFLRFLFFFFFGSPVGVAVVVWGSGFGVGGGVGGSS